MNPGNPRSLRIQSAFLLAALAVQYGLGMYVNLFVSFPDNANEGQLWEFAWSQVPLASHIILAFLILFGAIALLIRSIRQRNKNLTIASSVGLLAVLAAGVSGATFIPSQTDIFSYSMSIAFLVAILSYGWGLFSTQAA